MSLKTVDYEPIRLLHATISTFVWSLLHNHVIEGGMHSFLNRSPIEKADNALISGIDRELIHGAYMRLFRL